MARGGYREGSGRKKGSTNLLTQALRKKINAVGCIAFLQALADGQIEGATISERKDAAVALLRKVMADLRNMEVKAEGENEFKVIVEDYRASGNP